MPLVKLARRLITPGTALDEAEGTQYGAIPYRIVEGRVVFLMITSRRSANWVFPKGSPIKGLTPAETAMQETWEEAGVRGEIGRGPVGFYLHPHNNKAGALQKIELFPLLVKEQEDEWPEEPERFRHWALLPQARRLLASRGAARIANNLHRRLIRKAQPKT